MRRIAPALPLLVAALLSGALGAARLGHSHRGPAGGVHHHHAHLGPHRHAHAAVPHSHGGATGDDADVAGPHLYGADGPSFARPRPHGGPARANDSPAPPAEPDPGESGGEGYHQPPPAPPVPAAPPALVPVAAIVAAAPVRAAPHSAPPAPLHAPLRPRPPPG